MSNISVYIDNNCINTAQKNDALNELEKLHDEEKIMIEKTDTLDEEFRHGKGFPKGEKKSSNYIESQGPFVLGHSRLGHAVLGNSQEEKSISRILEILWGKKVRSAYTVNEFGDARHIYTASRYGGTYFVTNDKKLIEKAEEIEKEFTIKVTDPKNCLAQVKQRLDELEKMGYDPTM